MVDARPSALVLHDDPVSVVVAHLVRVDVDPDRVLVCSRRVRRGDEAERQAAAERGFGDDEGEGVIHVGFPSFGGRGRMALRDMTLRRAAPHSKGGAPLPS